MTTLLATMPRRRCPSLNPQRVGVAAQTDEHDTDRFEQAESEHAGERIAGETRTLAGDERVGEDGCSVQHGSVGRRVRNDAGEWQAGRESDADDPAID